MSGASLVADVTESRDCAPRMPARKRRTAEEIARLREEIASLDEDQFDAAVNGSTSAPAYSEINSGPIVLAIAAEIVRIGTEVLRAKGASPRPLVLIERLAHVGLDVVGLGGETLRAACSNVGLNYGYASSSGVPGGMMALAPSGSAENFGATAIRELVGSLGRSRRRDAAETVAAIAAARAAGLDDLASQFEAELAIGKPASLAEEKPASVLGGEPASSEAAE